MSVLETTDTEYYPYSLGHAIPEGLVVFDHVFVPTENVFLDGEVEHSASFAHSAASGSRDRLSNASAHSRAADVAVTRSPIARASK